MNRDFGLVLCLLVLITKTIFICPLQERNTCPNLEKCLCVCVFDSINNIVAANCTNVNGTLGDILDCLPPTIVNLTFRATSLNENGANFSLMINMKKLEILWNRPPDELPRSRDLHNFSESGLFEGLGKLKILRINFPTIGINANLLRPLENLEVLDLSNMGYISTAQLAMVFNGSRLRETPINVVLLKRMSGVNPTKLKQFSLEELFPLFEGMFIRELDISDNGEIYLYPGMMEYLPVLEVYRFAGISVRYDENWPEESFCFVIEAIFHQNLTFVDMSNVNTIGFGFFQNFVQQFMKKYIENWMQCYISPKKRGNCICQTHHDMCGSVLKANGSCDNFPQDLNPLKLIDFACLNYFRIPLPNKLGTFLARNTQYSFLPEAWKVKNRCFAKNVMKVCDFSRVKLPQSSAGIFTINGLKFLEELVVDYSDWGSYFVNVKFLYTFKYLRKLNLGGTTVGIYISNDTNNEIFNMSQNLLSLRLNDAKILSIPKYEFSPLHNLTYLDLSGNGLVNTSFDMSKQISLEYLNLSNNNLNNLTTNVIDVLEANSKRLDVYVDLSGNILSCNCDSFQFLQWMNKTKVHFVKKYQYLCVHPEGLRSLANVEDNLDSLRRRCFPPPDYSLFIAVATTLFSCLVLVFLSLLIFKMRWKIRYGCLWLKYRNELDDVTDYIYDAFVVYSDEDRYWVHQIMLKNLEKMRNLKLCVHYRDFVPGYNIEEQIVTNINASRKTIIVISPHFLESNWCEMEMQVARNRLYSEGKDVIVPIILIECPTEKLTATVKNILASTTYIKWSSEQSQEEFFWKQLTLAICKRVVNLHENHSFGETCLSHDEGNT